MGFFSWVGEKIENTVSAVADVVGGIGEMISDGYKCFTGQDDFEEAERLYNDVMKRFDKHKKYFEQQVEQYTSEIENDVKAINQAKIKIKSDLLPQFAEKMKYFKDIIVSDEFIKDCFACRGYQLDSVKSRKELFLIDFKRSPFKSNALAIVTLGFYTRKKAKETLLKVKEEVKRIEAEMAKMDSELYRLQLIAQSVKQSRIYLEQTIELYQIMLTRMDSSVNFLMIRCIRLAKRFVLSEMKAKNLPVSQQKELQAMLTISLTMSKMAKTRLSIESDVASVTVAKKELEDNCTKLRMQFDAA